MNVIDSVVSVMELLAFYFILLIIDKKNRISILKGILLLIGLTVVLNILNYFDFPYHMLFTSLVLIVAYVFVARRNIWDIIADILLAIIIISTIQALLMLAASALNNNLAKSYIFHICILMIIIVFAIIIEKKGYLNKILNKRYRNNRRLFLFIGVNFILFITIVSNIWNENTSLFFRERINFSLVFISYLIVNGFLVLSLIRIKTEKNKNKMFIEYEKHMTDIIHKLRRSEHDYYGHLNAINAIIDDNKDIENKEKVNKYINEIINKNKTNAAGISDNTVLSAFMYYTQKSAGDVGIDIQYEISKNAPKYKISEHDLIEILSNLITNAIEAVSVSGLSFENKKILLLFEENMISVKNPLDKQLDDSDIELFLTDGFSTKGDSRGLGFTNVIDLVKKNNIQMEISVPDSTFQVNLSFVN